MGETVAGTADYAQAVAGQWNQPRRRRRSFWSSPVVLAAINRRVSGDPGLAPEAYFAHKYCVPRRRRGFSLGCAGGELERDLVRLDACEHILGVDIAEKRIEGARRVTPPEMSARLTFECADLETWRPEGRFDLIIAKDVLHHVSDLPAWLDFIADALTDDGVLYVDEFVGPDRFQWTDGQLEIVNRLLDRLSPALRRDIVLDDGSPRPAAGRPSVESMIREDPSESAHSSEIPRLLAERLDVVEARPKGGALYHLFFNRIMGNFDEHDDLVRVLMEADAILTETGVLQNDYLWAVCRRPGVTGPSP
jgi:SAM-dependent methyltransferase